MSGTRLPGRSAPGTAELQLGPSPAATKPAWHSRGYLPHVDVDGLIQHLTFHLADSLPAVALEQLEQSIAAMPEDEKRQRRRERWQSLLDEGHGSGVLRQAEAARVVQDTLLHFDGDRYRLLAWTVMPNHVHVLMEPLAGWPVARIVQSWKSFSARRVNAWLDGQGGRGRAGARRSQGDRSRSLWARDYWDRYIRDERHLAVAANYVEHNPVAAGLATAAEDWPWGSARARKREDAELELGGPKDEAEMELDGPMGDAELGIRP